MNRPKFTEGSFLELFRTSLPLMLSFLSAFAMMFADRLFLAHYSLHAHNAAVSAGTLVWAFTYSFQIYTEMSSVYVAQYNGAERLSELARPVWQVIWVSLGSIVLFYPLANYGCYMLFDVTASGGQEQIDYFSTLVSFGPVYGLLGAMMAFFVGQGRTLVVTLTAVVANLINIVLDPIFIFGLDGFLAPMGPKGAALATALGATVQMLLLFLLFMRKGNREKHGSGDWTFDAELLWEHSKVAWPPAFFILLEIGGWACYYGMMAYRSSTHILVAGMCQNFALLFFFFGVGLEKGAAAVAGNLIGAGREDKIPRVRRNGLLMTFVFFVISAIVLFCYPEYVMNWFLDSSELAGNDWSDEQVASMYEMVRFGLGITCFYILLENIRLLMMGLLSAAGDTFFLMWSGVVAIWFFLIVPTYIATVIVEATVQQCLWLWVTYGVVAMVIYFVRFESGAWRGKKLLLRGATHSSV